MRSYKSGVSHLPTGTVYSKSPNLEFIRSCTRQLRRRNKILAARLHCTFLRPVRVRVGCSYRKRLVRKASVSDRGDRARGANVWPIGELEWT